ncbi:DUF2752 domain-containing protein [Jatrophihabitans telluris]|uniref:DUF2752 domain-containing protein n=1 Tax=Jatrophihabitans telluris TaxID=2038343 RepID=A0ABY4QYE9_9ACTN|nr:DUF2752 domain-containing protein [Jatrophihabitans telluris]UQX88333.1 DUF2752 domain-containing protein [Jatrophihabitans telluris]
MARSRTTALPAVPLVTAGTAVLASVGLYFVNPNTTHVPLCPFHAVTGLNCPLCGATRATYALLHGDVVTALHDNAVYVLGLPLLFWLGWRWYRATAGPDRPGASRHRLMPRAVFIALLVLLVVFGVVRNLPIGAFLSPPA